MSGPLCCEVFYHPDARPHPDWQANPHPESAESSENPASGGGAGDGVGGLRATPGECAATEVTAGSAAAARLARLGIAVPGDLPAILLSTDDGRLRLQGVRLSAEEIVTLAAGRGWRPQALTAYTASWCPDCRRLKRLLGEAGLDCAEVDIELEPGAETEVLRRSNGRRVVPTLVLDGRVWAFNPEPALLRRLVSA